ncbi:MAG: hypothetical protein ABSD46_01725 [Bacteroidota bacterium]
MKINKILLLGIILSLIFIAESFRLKSSTENLSNVADSLNIHIKSQKIAQSIADYYVRTLRLTLWSMDINRWITNQGYKEAIDTFQKDVYSHWPYEDYCFKTQIKEKDCLVEYYFFNNGDYLNPKATLQQILIFNLRTKQDNILDQEIWKIISDSLTKSFGMPHSIPNDNLLSPFSIHEKYGMESKLWEDKSKRIILAEYYRWEGEVRNDFFVIFARDKSLDSLAHRLETMEQIRSDRINKRQSIISELCDSLRQTAAPHDLFCRTDSSGVYSFNDLVKIGYFISKAKLIGDSVHLPLYLMALCIYGQSYSPQGNGDGSGPFTDVDSLRYYNIIFEWDHMGLCWHYSKKPLMDIYTKYSNSYWGQRAFVMLQNIGWCLDGMCNGNDGSYVASMGEEFLKRCPESLYAANVLLTIAKGYETNWNVSTCKTGSDYMYDSTYRYDEPSRLKSILTYERIITAFPNSCEAEIAKIRLSHLKLGINTGRTDYFFVWD